MIPPTLSRDDREERGTGLRMARARLANLYPEASGGFGPWIVAHGRTGPVVRRRRVYRRVASPGQQAQALRLKDAAALWSSLEPDEAQAWNLYARGLTRRNPVSGRTYAPTGFNTFSGYAMTLLHLDPESEIPALPPDAPFEGDAVRVALLRKPGAARFVADAPNSDGIVTELLLQRLATPRRSPTRQYRTAGFVAFAAGGLSRDVPVEPGTYAGAARFIERATGRVAGMRTLGMVTVA